MLTVMLYNGWIFISVIIGSGLGYFVFGQTFIKINIQNCHLIKNAFCTNECPEQGTHVFFRLFSCDVGKF